MLHADIGLRLGGLDLDVTLDVARGDVVAVLGPNGAGKTTTLRAIAGLLAIDRGRITLDGVPFDDPAAGVRVPPHQRRTGVVFQDYLLFAHLSALDNVAFGLRAGGVPRPEARRRAREWLARVGLDGQAGARPRALSGGQAQRVALARALAAEPRLLLLDEPLAALDAGARASVRSELRQHLSGFAGPAVLVTHDAIDAMVLAERLVVLEAGRVVQAGPTAEVTARPRSRYVADLVGVNLLLGRAAGDRLVRLTTGHDLVVAEPVPADEVAVALRPRAVTLARQPPAGSARNRWEANVSVIHPDRDRVRVTLEGPVPVTAEITPGALAELGLHPDDRVWASVKAVDLDAYPR